MPFCRTAREKITPVEELIKSKRNQLFQNTKKKEKKNKTPMASNQQFSKYKWIYF